MSGLAVLLSKLKEAKAERIVYGPNEVAVAHAQDRSWPITTQPVAAGTLLAAVSEVLSQDELHAIPQSRPRIVRYEHDDQEYVVEIAREPRGIRLAVRLAKATLKKESFRMVPSDVPASSPSPPAPAPPPPPSSAPASTAPREEPPGRPRVKADKHTVRVELDDEGNPVDTMMLDIGRTTKGRMVAAKVGKRETRPVKRPSALLANRPIHRTIVVPREGKPATNDVVRGEPHGAHVTFLYAPGGFVLEDAAGKVIAQSLDGAAVRGELFVPASMALRVLPGPYEAIVSYYRYSE